MSNKPNILFIMSDEHDAAVTGCYGDSLVRTPNLDRLAANGVCFDSCYTPSPLCVPCRLSITSGKYVSHCGAWYNGSTLESNETPSLPRLLRQAGYTPYLCGKHHLVDEKRYGFVDLLNGKLTGSNKAGFRDPRDQKNVDNAWESRVKSFHTGEESVVLSDDREVTNRVSQFLKDYDESQGPFFLHAGYFAPHFPLIVPDDIYQYYKGKTPDPIPALPFEEQPFNYQQQQLGFGSRKASREDIRKGRDLYWGLVDWFDREVGKLLSVLADSDVADNTIVIYTTDHGENKGDHGMWWKNCLYDHGARVPLIVSWPKRWAGGQRRAEACSLLDLIQGIAELAGTSCPEDWDGDSILPWLDNPDYQWKDVAVSEYYGHNRSSSITMLRHDGWKYVYHARFDEEFGPQYELFNMIEDPQELKNLADDPQYSERRARMHQMMLDEIGDHPDQITQRANADIRKRAAG